MEDPIERMRSAREGVQARAALKQAAKKSEERRMEREMNEFLNSSVRPAFNRVKSELFGEKLTELPEKPDHHGFKVQDFPNTEFCFWITFRGRVPEANALRTYGKAPAKRVPTVRLGSKDNFDLTSVTSEDVCSAIAYSYGKATSPGFVAE